MKKLLVLFCSIVFAMNVHAQKPNPVKWTFSAIKKSDKQYEVVASATIDAPWHMYSQFVSGGPMPTTFTFSKNPLIQLAGKTKEKGKLQKMYDKNFKTELSFFSDKVDFIQTVNLKVASKTNLVGVVEYSICNDDRCLPPAKVSFEVALN
ncbi:MAG: protein-disulfide reductase DsbD N-terminal domain-containing protein [Sediminibacterium sp.]|jgi:thiol:disulfide interchange protein DsbD|nr:protein-disulfide reductase DsbD N-terminal domain-containing protein [Sediminibacterium sp.]